MNRGLKKYVIAVPPWIILGAVAILVPIFVFWTLQNISKEREYVVRLLTEKGSALIRSIEAGTRTGMMGMRGGGFRIQRLISETAQTPDIVYLMVTDATGNVLASSGRRKSESSTGLTWIFSVFPGRKRCSGGKFADPKDPPFSKSFAVSRPREFLFEVRMEDGCRGPMAKGNAEEIPPPEQPEIVFVGLNMGPIEAARKQATTNTILLVSIFF